MSAETKISVSVPGSDNPNRYISVRVKQKINLETSVCERPGKVFVVSDIEGNFDSFCNLLHRAGVVDQYLHWKFSDNHLVILGDCFDRGEHVTECLWLIYALEEKAKIHGGRVHFILGNHEIMNLNGDWRYVHPKYAELTKSTRSSVALYGGNNELWRWLCTKNIIEQIGDILFVHGGISRELLSFHLPIDEINNRARPYYIRANETFNDDFLFTIFNSDKSPFWYRGYYQPDMNEEIVDSALKQFEASTIITGHTVSEKISSFFNGKVINTDTDHTAEHSQGLLVINEKFFSIDQKGKKDRIK